MKLHIICMAFIAMILISCNTKNKKNPSESVAIENVQLDETQNKKEKNEDKKISTDSVEKAEPENNTPKATKASIDWDKKIIKIANVSLELKNYKAYNSTIHKNIKNFGAYIASEEQTETYDKIENTITIKVPVDKFDEVINSFSGDDLKLLEKKITTEDVTAEVYDTKGRMETKKIVREQYYQLLKQAKNMKDILEVQNEINGITEEVEAAGNRVSFLNHEAAYSTIHLKYFQLLNGTTINNNNPNFISQLKEAFKNGCSNIGSLFLFLVNIWPLLFIITIGWFAIRRWKSNKNIVSQKQV